MPVPHSRRISSPVSLSLIASSWYASQHNGTGDTSVTTGCQPAGKGPPSCKPACKHRTDRKVRKTSSFNLKASPKIWNSPHSTVPKMFFQSPPLDHSFCKSFTSLDGITSYIIIYPISSHQKLPVKFTIIHHAWWNPDWNREIQRSKGPRVGAPTLALLVEGSFWGSASLASRLEGQDESIL